MKVAYYSPLPPSRSGIADYSALLLPALREHVDVVVAERGKRAPDADVALYHVGNDPDAHDWIVDALLERPGVVVLHEYVLHHLIAGMTIGRGNGRAYLEAMERELGVVGRLLGLGVLDNLLPLLWETQPERGCKRLHLVLVDRHLQHRVVRQLAEPADVGDDERLAERERADRRARGLTHRRVAQVHEHVTGGHQRPHSILGHVVQPLHAVDEAEPLEPPLHVEALSGRTREQ